MRLFLALSITVITLVAGNAPAVAQGPNRAGIVVSYGDGRVESVCVEFAEPEISGADLMNHAGFSVVLGTGGNTSAVCMIDDIGCRDPADCWCNCHGSDCRYWSYHTLEGGAWKYSGVGAATRKVHNGDVDGWAWGKGGVGSGAEPELRTFDDLCPPPVATPSPLPLPPPLPMETPLPTIAFGPTSEVAAATSPPPAVTLDSKPTAAATTRAPTVRPTGPSPTKIAPAGEEDDQSGFPWQIPAFAVVAASLLGTAVVLANRRARGTRS
jgi:hypothetical protein